ncbi:hypothetical protein QTP88_023447 [Uroleucon formosanum]
MEECYEMANIRQRTRGKSLPMNELVSSIVKLEYFKVFIQIFEELYYESNTLIDYDIQTQTCDSQEEVNDSDVISAKTFIFVILMHLPRYFKVYKLREN